jgi:hypothetical protein
MDDVIEIVNGLPMPSIFPPGWHTSRLEYRGSSLVWQMSIYRPDGEGGRVVVTVEDSTTTIDADFYVGGRRRQDKAVLHHLDYPPAERVDVMAEMLRELPGEYGRGWRILLGEKK